MRDTTDGDAVARAVHFLVRTATRLPMIVRRHHACGFTSLGRADVGSRGQRPLQAELAELRLDAGGHRLDDGLLASDKQRGGHFQVERGTLFCSSGGGR